MSTDPGDLIDGCDADMTADPVSDKVLPYVVLFGSLLGFQHDEARTHDQARAILARAAQWRALFGGGP